MSPLADGRPARVAGRGWPGAAGALGLAICFWLAALAVTPGLGAQSVPLRQSHRERADDFFDNHTIIHLAFEASEPAMNSLRRTPREYVRVTLREGEVVYRDVAVHLKGGSGSFRRVDDRPGFTLDFNRYAPDRRFHGLKKIHLNNGAQDPTRLSELIGGQLFREAGVPAARAAHALVELNGRRLGLYVVMEAMDDDFLARYFQDQRGNLYGQTRNCDVTDGIERMEGDGPLDYADLNNLADAVLQPDSAKRFALVQQKLAADRFISFMALEILLAHHDGYTMNRHNYRIYHDPATRQCAFIPHDLDQLMKRSTPGLLPQPRGLVAQVIMNTPEFRARYQARVSELATNVFIVPRLTNRVDGAVEALLPALEAYDPGIANTLKSQAAEFKARIIKRGEELPRQLEALAKGTPAPVNGRSERENRRR